MITVPESVQAYEGRNDVQMAVTLLLGLKGKTPPLDGWGDVASYYGAWLAAQQTKADYAIFLERVWNDVWSSFPTSWRPCQPGDPYRSDLSVSVDAVWSEKCFSRRFERAGIALELSVWLESGLRVGIVLYNGREEALLDEGSVPGWQQLNGYDFLWSEERVDVSEGIADLSVFRPLVAKAWSVIEGASEAT